MSTDRTCNRSFCTKEEDKIFENTLAIYFKDDNLFKKMAEALPGKSHDDIIYHYYILLEDLNSIESGHVPLPNYLEMQRDSNQKSKISKADVEWRRGIPWTEEEHRSLLPSKQPCTAASSGTGSRPISRIGSELEELITEHADEDNDISSIFDVGKAPSSHAMPSHAAHSGISGYAVASIGAVNAPENTVAAHSGMRSFTAASFSAPESTVAAHSRMTNFTAASIGGKNAPENTVAAHSGLCSYTAASFSAPENMMSAHGRMTSFAVASFDAVNAPENTVAAYRGMPSYTAASFSSPESMTVAHSRMSSFVVDSIGAQNAPLNMVVPAPLPPFAPSSNIGVGVWPSLNTPKTMKAYLICMTCS
ncbi:hypothetical protein HAX54_037839 [Datura stramonium]|uniref:Myb-like domain-containing protein n=1 Tax=Datura stramonium TaxID=4076 RepID=A0ABS8VKI5_DATST|nr:hypothetical protein [Datura stramonium]